MKQAIKSIFAYGFQPRLIIFFIALYNFTSIWIEAEMTKHLGTLVDPWFQPWSYFNEPSLLLLAATFLLLSKWWSNAISLSLSGYVLANGTFLINKTG